MRIRWIRPLTWMLWLMTTLGKTVWATRRMDHASSSSCTTQPITTSAAAETTNTAALLQQSNSNGLHRKQLHPRKLQEEEEETLQSNSSIAIMEQIRTTVLSDYDRGSYPFESHWKKNRRTGLPIRVGFNFHRVFAVDVTSSTADIVVWARLEWNDPRLAWDPSEYQNVSTIFVWIGDGTGMGETSEIWTPDLELWNLETSLSESLTDTFAKVQSDGTVFWSRPGHIKPVCKFTGLDDFPFDTLSCVMEIGSWAYSGLYLRPSKLEDGYTIGGSNTAGESYAEYSLKSVACEEYVYPPFMSAPDEDWPVLFYTVAFERAWQPYARGYLVMQVILNLVAFCCFWLPPHVGERMGLSITSVLAAVASELVVASNLPAASEITWFAKFSLASLIFTAITLFESAAVIYLYYHTGDDLLPRYVKYLHRVIRTQLKQQPNDSNNDNHTKSQQQGTSATSSSPPSSGASTSTDLKKTQETEDERPRRRNSSREQSSDFVVRSSGRSAVGNISYEVMTEEDGEEERSDGADMASHEFHSESTHAVNDDTSARNPPPQQQQVLLGRDADDYKNAREMQNNRRWQKVAALMDEVSRVVLPLTFAIYMGTTFGVIL